jgi:hypothetical protein
MTICLAAFIVLVLFGAGCSSEDAGGSDEGAAAADSGDGAGGLSDAAESADTGEADAAGDAAELEDAEEPDDGLYVPFDLGPDYDYTPSAPDVHNPSPSGFGDCPVLGISAEWVGTFQGTVAYDMVESFPGAAKQGLFLVDGDLTFEIKCLEKKLVVAGLLEGVAQAAGEIGDHPFAAAIVGDYDPVERRINAKMGEGEVRVFKVVSVFFEGGFNGQVNIDGEFHGTWDAQQTSNSLDLEGDAWGSGKWTALPAVVAPVPEE